MTFQLSLEETARPSDKTIETNGLKFLVDERYEPYVDGLTIDVQPFYGREGLVAYNPHFGRGCW